MVKFSDTWCPANCHPQAASPGWPNTLKQYRSGSKRPADAGVSARSTCSIAITETTLAYPARLVPVMISSCPSRRWPSSSAPIGNPARCSDGRKDQSRRSSPNGKHALSRWDPVSAARKAAAAAVICPAVSGTSASCLMMPNRIPA